MQSTFFHTGILGGLGQTAMPVGKKCSLGAADVVGGPLSFI